MCDKIFELTGNVLNDICEFSLEITNILDDKMRCLRVDNKLKLCEHIEPRYYNQLSFRFLPNSDIHTIKIDDVWYYIYQYANVDGDWVLWSDLNNLEIVLHPDWAYRDLVGAMALLGQGGKARLWNRIVISERAAGELGYDRLEFRIKGVRLRDTDALFM